MTTEASEKGNKPSEAGNALAPQNAPGCWPGCDCGKPAGDGNTKLKIVVFLVVVAAVCGILLFKTTSAKQNASGIGKSGFSNPLVTTGPNTPANSAGQQGGIGASLSSISALNTVAADLDAVFLVIPSKDNATPTKETVAAVAAVERTLKERDISIGIFTLQVGSPDYIDVTTKISVPSIVVLKRGL